MTTPNRLNVTIGMSHLNKVGNDGSGNHANTTNLAESADQCQVRPLDQHHHSAQQLLDYSNPSLSLDDQPPFDEYSLSIQPLDECSISITTSTSDEYLNGGGCHGWQSQEVEFSKCPTASTISTLPCLLNICYAMDAFFQLDEVQFIHHDHNDQQESEESPSQKQQNDGGFVCLDDAWLVWNFRVNFMYDSVF